MTAPALYPLRFEPILRRLIWGGRRLGTVLGKSLGPAADYAESWEISDYRDAVSIVNNGPLAGTSLRTLVAERPAELLGPRLASLEQFPLLVKFIDACEVLSVQVHPDDEQGRRLSGDRGKTEAWVVMAVEPGGVIYAGLERGVSRSDFEAAVAAGTVPPLLHRIEPGPGDCILIESGTVHAIGAGVLLAEIQQTSDATYRVDDWGRVGPDGQPRPLHLKEALEVIDFDLGPVDPITPTIETHPWGQRERLARSAYFEFERFTLHDKTTLGRDQGCTILLGLEGRSIVEHQGSGYPLDHGASMLVPAAVGRVVIAPEGASTVLSCVIP